MVYIGLFQGGRGARDDDASVVMNVKVGVKLFVDKFPFVSFLFHAPTTTRQSTLKKTKTKTTTSPFYKKCGADKGAELVLVMCVVE